MRARVVLHLHRWLQWSLTLSSEETCHSVYVVVAGITASMEPHSFE